MGQTKTQTLQRTMAHPMDKTNSMSILKFLPVKYGIVHGAVHLAVGY